MAVRVTHLAQQSVDRLVPYDAFGVNGPLLDRLVIPALQHQQIHLDVNQSLIHQFSSVQFKKVSNLCA